MESLATFLAMGGYAAFIWPAYGISALVLAGLWWASRARLRVTEAELARLQETAEARTMGDAP